MAGRHCWPPEDNANKGANGIGSDPDVESGEYATDDDASLIVGTGSTVGVRRPSRGRSLTVFIDNACDVEICRAESEKKR